MITREQLLEVGYKPFTQQGLSTFTDSYYQKRFDDEVGKKYFITIAEYDNRGEEWSDLPDFSYSPDSQFESNGVTFDVKMHQPESIEQMEKFFEEIWKSMNCDYYEKWFE